MKIIIVGCGKVGQKLAQKLGAESDNDVTVIDLKQAVISDIVGQYDVMGVVGSGVNIDTLDEAGVVNADLLIAVTGSDELNLMSCLMAKKKGNCQTIARVRKPEYSKSVNLIKEDLGLAMIINPEQAAAQEIARVLRLPSAIQIDTFAKGRVEILKFRVPEDSVLDNMKVMEIVSKLNCDVLVCGVERGEDAFIPGGNFVLKAGDLVSIVSSIQGGIQFFKKIGIKTHRVKNTIIVGGGATAFYLAGLLLQSGIDVKLIERDLERCEELCRLLPKATVVHGDGSDNWLLLEQGVEYAESFVSLTNIDEVNILLSLFAKSKMQSGKLVTKINRIAYDEVISGLDLDTTVYPKDITAEYIIKFIRAMKNTIGNNVETMHMILDDKAEALEFRIKENSPVSGISIDKLKLKKNILIACITRGGKIIIPRGRDIIEKGDTVIVVTTHKGFEDISDILEEA
ncbi:MAG: Trk system potassium transporter TrkA [Clostridia bacterium]|nr:Trk system potassium transporter TrkA [Clostridia bacterium]